MKNAFFFTLEKMEERENATQPLISKKLAVFV